MIEQERLEGRLQQIQQVVVAPDVSQLVGQDHIELLRRHFAENARRDQNHRTQSTEYSRDLDQR